MQINQNEAAAERGSGKEKTAGKRGVTWRQVGEKEKVVKKGRKEMDGCKREWVSALMLDRKKERGGKKSGSPAMAGRGMPGPGTGERDGGWSMLTSLLPTEHIPTTESWRLFNLQILKLLYTKMLLWYWIMLLKKPAAQANTGMKNTFFSSDWQLL